ncbi:hypothetical protein [Puniceibacterium sp. IMCC21224]|uniref:hypothetical protein n=1 Tax=Puniceibacterium sp. IMCC21224 TaxID=1618204 RepID=UPI00064DF939|nr:hypothetical protein [Puniceibacterium sp. IMCC21224]KMK68572.1 hypothetical protein IMCC21224_113455 [Puniceibacterium sp. IMCC21224]
MPDATPATARIEVFRPGTFTPMGGGALTYSAADLAAIADIYDFDTAPAPVVVGHPATDAPAFGWITGFEFDATDGRLFATLGEIDPAFSEAVKAGRYKKVSMSFFRPDQEANPVPGTWYPKHVGFLGGAAPAVSGLKNVKFSVTTTEAATFTAAFGERGFQETASLLRGLRDFIIDKFGMEDADKALPTYAIEWLDDMEIDANRTRFSAPAPITTIPAIDPEKDPAVTTTPNPDFATREADLNTRDAALKAREDKQRHTDHVAFADSLVADGKILPASKDKVVALLDTLPSEASVSFAEGGAKISPADAIRQVLSEQPKAVSFGRQDLGGDPQTSNASFASDGKQVDGEQLELHTKATAYQRQHPGTEYLAAVRAVS